MFAKPPEKPLAVEFQLMLRGKLRGAFTPVRLCQGHACMQ